jgi:hypothetical protein
MKYNLNNSTRSAITALMTALFAFSMAAKASETFCAVTEKTNDGFVEVREGPGMHFSGLGKITISDFLYVGTEQCRNDFGPSLCSSDQQWSFVEEVAGSKLKGWVRSTLLRRIKCPGS